MSRLTAYSSICLLASLWIVGGSLVSCAPGSTKQRKHIPLDLATWHNNQGVQYLHDQDLSKAEVEFKTAVELDPKYPEAQSNLGLIFKYQGDLEEASKQFKIAIKLDPKWAAPYNHLGTVYLKEGRFSKALDWFNRSASLDKKFADAHYNLGVTYIERAKGKKHPKGDWQEAAKALKKATTIDPRLYNAHIELANTYRNLHETEKAILRYRLAIETNPRDPTPWELLGELYEEQGDDAKAQECHRQAHILSPEGIAESEAATAESLVTLGESYRRRGQFQQALKVFEAATRQKADFWQAHFGIGQTLEAMKDCRRAVQAYQAVLEIHPQHPESQSRIKKLEKECPWKSGRTSN